MYLFNLEIESEEDKVKKHVLCSQCTEMFSLTILKGDNLFQFFLLTVVDYNIKP